jgi:hypothetical protein
MNSEQVVQAINEQIDLLNGQPIDDFSGDTLSRLAVRLAAYKAGLGRHVTMAKKATWEAEKQLKMAKAKAYQELREEGQGDGAAKELKNLRIEKEYDAYIAAQELEDQLNGLSYNVHDLIDAIKSRVINQQMEMRESNVH